MNRHLDIALMAGGHDGLQEVLEVVPQLLLGDGLVLLKQLVQPGHPLRLPAGEGHVVLLREAHDIVRHLFRVLFNFRRLVIERRGAVPHGVEQVSAGPVEHRHEVVADDLDAKPGQIFNGLLVVLNVLVPGGQADLDVIVDVDGLHHVHVETIGFELLLDCGDFANLPHLAGHLVVERPHDALHPGDLLDVAELDLVVALAVPAPCHFHGKSLLITLFSRFRP